MRIRFHKRAVLYGIVIGFIVTVLTIVIVSLFTSPEQLVFVGPASFGWIVLLVLVAKWMSRRKD